jgi:hypothetical protein
MRGSPRALLVTMLLAAGCGDDPLELLLAIDAGADAPPSCHQTSAFTTCDPLAPRGQQGCAAGQKCTYAIREQDGLSCPVIACLPDGSRGLAEACARHTVEFPTSGSYRFDDCVAGLACASDDTCRDLCGFGGGANERCADRRCRAEPGLFEFGDAQPFYGVCTGRPLSAWPAPWLIPPCSPEAGGP